MDGGFSASYYRGGRGGWRCRRIVLYMRTQGGGMTDCGKKDEKRYGFYGREWTFFGITRPIEAGFNKDAN